VKKKKRRVKQKAPSVRRVRVYPDFVSRLASSGLLADVEKRTMSFHVTLRDLYEGGGASSIIDARREVYAWLQGQGKSINEIARLFDRAPSGIHKMVHVPGFKEAAHGSNPIFGSNPLLKKRGRP